MRGGKTKILKGGQAGSRGLRLKKEGWDPLTDYASTLVRLGVIFSHSVYKCNTFGTASHYDLPPDPLFLADFKNF